MNSNAGPSWSSPTSVSSAPSPCMRFHAHHGDNIVLLRDRTVAFRKSSFADGIVFSARPLWPNELFMLEIDRNENGWSGHLRLGLTSVDPNLRLPLPHYALPDMNASGRAWVYAITRHRQRVYDGVNGELDLPLTRIPLFNYLVNPDSEAGGSQTDDSIGTHGRAPQPNGTVAVANGVTNNNSISARSSLSNDGIRLPTDVGSQIGVYYRLAPDGTAEMHYVINGVDQGPSAVGIPYNGRDGPRLYALVDVYGSTKQVRIVQLAPCVAPLQHLCRICILKYVDTDPLLDFLPLPEKLKAFLRFKETHTRQNDLTLLDDLEFLSQDDNVQGRRYFHGAVVILYTFLRIAIYILLGETSQLSDEKKLAKVRSTSKIMGLTLYTTTITPNTEIKKRAQRIRMVLEGLDIPFEIIDISQTGKEQDREFMRNNCKVVNGKAGPPPPQIFNGNDYCGGYDEFENAVESNELRSFLKLEPLEQGEGGDTEVDVGGFGEAAPEDEDAVWARRMAARRQVQDEDGENEQAEPQAEPEPEPEVLEEDEDAAWRRRAAAKRQQQQEEDEEAATAANAEEANAEVEEPEPEVLEEDEDAAWKRRMQQKRKALEEEQPQEEEPQAAEETEPVVEEDEDAVWQRRLALKKQQMKQDEDVGEEEQKQEPEGDETEVADVLIEDEDAAWQRRAQAKKQQQQQKQEADNEEEEEIVGDDDVEVEEDET